MPASQPPPDEPDFGRYRVVSKLRSGPITDFYRAEQGTLGRSVFIKALGRGILPGSPFAAALEREARLLTELDHPNVIRFLDFTRDEDSMWLVLEYVDGFTLDELIGAKGRLSSAGAAAIGLAVSDALAHAHARGIVHRDIQPHNILVSRAGVVKLANFAAAADERLPTAPELLEGSAGFGTPAYMSPEQLLGEPEDARSDIFSLGIVLYEMLTGKRPFEPVDGRASARSRHDSVLPPSRIASGATASLDRAVRRCLAKMPSDRFATAAELSRVLALELEEARFLTSADAVASELVRLGLVPAPPGAAPRRDSIRAGASRVKPVTIGAALQGYLAALLLVVVGGSAIQYSSAAGRRERASGGVAKLELVPPRSAYLRVVVDPWARVIVDGEEVDIDSVSHTRSRLPAGVHYIRLEHPNAPAERRTVTARARRNGAPGRQNEGSENEECASRRASEAEFDGSGYALRI